MASKAATTPEEGNQMLGEVMANHVAGASKEARFLGFGGVDVSNAEKATLSEIGAALGTRT